MQIFFALLNTKSIGGSQGSATAMTRNLQKDVVSVFTIPYSECGAGTLVPVEHFHRCPVTRRSPTRGTAVAQPRGHRGATERAP